MIESKQVTEVKRKTSEIPTRDEEFHKMEYGQENSVLTLFFGTRQKDTEGWR